MNESPVWKFLYPLLAALAGSLTALSFRGWDGLTRTQITLTIFVGASFAYFVSPLLFSKVTDIREAGGILYLLASGSNALIPLAIKRLGTLVGNGS
jgi:hypothetical protein